ncbi:MAG: hypothetical protein AAF843_21015 [Bacteroidota bacterium]
MIGRFIKVFWFFTLLGGLLSLLYVYAGLPEGAPVYLSDARELFSDKEIFFYVALAILAIQNFAFYALSKNIRYKREGMRLLVKNWLVSFAGALNIFCTIMLHFLYIMNSGERIEFDNFGFLTFVALGLVIAWLLALPILIFREVKK